MLSPLEMSSDNNSNKSFKLPPISTIDNILPNGSWIPPTNLLKSPPYNNNLELKRDTSFNNQIEHDIDQVIKQCISLSDNILVNNKDLIYKKPLLDNMIHSANEILNSLLRLRKHQLLIEQQQHNHRVNNNSTIQILPTSTTTSTTSTTTHNIPTSNITTTITNNTNTNNTNTNNNNNNNNNNNKQKRRGKRPAFQGRCHSCNISETPEWRRGPDGARTLCNACGLHYAKLARKQQENKNMNELLYSYRRFSNHKSAPSSSP